VDNSAILVMRGLEEEGVRSRGMQIHLTLPNAVAIYILNHKREMLADMERRYEFTVMVRVDESLAPSGFKIDAVKMADPDSDDEDGEETKPQERSENRDREPREAREPREGNREPREGAREGSREGGRERGGRSRGGRDRNRTPRRPDSELVDPPMGESIKAVQNEDENDNFGNVAPAEPDEADDVDGNRDPSELRSEGNRRRGRRGGRGRRDGVTREGNVAAAPREGNTERAPRAERAPREPRDPNAERAPRPERAPRAPREASSERGPRREPRAERPSSGVTGFEGQPVIPAPSGGTKIEPKFYGRRPRSDEGNEGQAAAASANQAQKPYEVVQEAAPEQKKKGWWNRITE
ncbi:MAG: ribonuclease, Rne/Rng family domain protein, partial [Micavibrio sp.]|nr:ribonuclease, Rne/Rng family domain protein [Micavibrio sp.]